MRNRMNKRINKAFTLVEILIVVVILGILAAIVVPQFANATKDSQAGNIKAQIKSVQNQIELFKAREGAYPLLADLNAAPDSAAPGGWGVMIDGADGAGGRVGGYLKAAPKNPAVASGVASIVEAGTLVVATGEMDGSDPTAAGWAYDEATGDFGALNYSEATGEVIVGHN